MQILGKRSKILLIAVAIIMLVAVGISFATWDISAVKATNGSSSAYANAKVGDIIEFGQYYIDSTVNKKDIEWLVVDKDERTGQLTLMSRYILACGSYFGNYYNDINNAFENHYGSNIEIGLNPFNQAYVDSTIRAFLNNLQRLDIGGDSFDENTGYAQGGENTTQETGLLASVGYSNRKYYTGLNTSSQAYINNSSGLVHQWNNEVLYQRPISSIEYVKRTAAKGFYDEAFSNEQKSMIIPKAIGGYTGNRWPDSTQEISKKSYIEGALDKVWIASATELNIMNGYDWENNLNDAWTNPSDEANSTVFEYFKSWNQYSNPYDRSRKNISLEDSLKAHRTAFALEDRAGNYSIPVYNKGTTIENENIGTGNTSDNYWTRSPVSSWYTHIRIVGIEGVFPASPTYDSQIGARPCIILKY